MAYEVTCIKLFRHNFENLFPFIQTKFQSEGRYFTHSVWVYFYQGQWESFSALVLVTAEDVMAEYGVFRHDDSYLSDAVNAVRVLYDNMAWQRIIECFTFLYSHTMYGPARNWAPSNSTVNHYTTTNHGSISAIHTNTVVFSSVQHHNWSIARNLSNHEANLFQLGPMKHWCSNPQWYKRYSSRQLTTPEMMMRNAHTHRR